MYTERRSEFLVYLRRETGTSLTLRREQLRRRIPLSLTYNLSYGRTDATEVSFCASFNACTPDVVELLQQNRVLGTLTGHATVPRVNNLIDPIARESQVAGGDGELAFLGSALLPAVRPRRGRSRLVPPADAGGGAQLARPRRRDLRPEVDVATETGNFVPPEHRFYAGGPNDVRGFDRNELGPVVYVVSKAEVDDAAADSGRQINPDSVQVSATGGNTLAVGNVELRVPSPVFGSRLRLAAFVDAGGAWQRPEGDPVIRVTPGVGLRVATPLGPLRFDVAYNPYQLQAGPLFQFDENGDLTLVPGQGDYVLDRDGRFTVPLRGGAAVLMRRRLARVLFVFVLGTLAMVLGVVTSMTLTPPGRDLLARTVSRVLDRIVLGHVDVGAISGSFLYDLVLQDLVVRDTSGTLLADIPRVRVGYQLPNLLAGQVVLSSVQLERPVIQLIKHRNGRMNFEEVLQLGKGAAGGKSPLVDFHNVRMNGGTLRIALPWNPDRALVTQAQKDSALQAERARPGRVIEESPEGLRRIILLSDLTTRMGRLRIATPDRLPFTIDLDSLATRINDPAVSVRDAAGRIVLRGDSAIFSLSRGGLPDTRFSGGGAVTWPRDTILYDFQVISPHVNLEDLRWVSPNFPSMQGSGILTARSVSGVRTEYDIRDLRLAAGRQDVSGELVAITQRRRGLGVRDMRLQLRDLDLDAVRPYLDTLPFYGTLSGTVSGSGFLDDLDVRLDWAFADARVPGNPVTTIAGEGRVGARGDEGLVFTGFEVRSSDIDLRTVRLIAPAVILEGRLAATGRLDGPLHDVTFDGTARHRDGSRPPSVMVGQVHLDTRFDTLGLATDVALDPLSFEGIRRAFPTLRSRGEVRGRFRSEGTLGRLAVDADISGAIGNVRAEGFTTLLPPYWGAENLLLRFSRVDLGALTGREFNSSLNGELRVTGSIDTLRAPEGQMELALTRSRLREWVIDSVFARGASRDSMIRMDTAYAEWQGARAAGAGTLGWAAPHRGEMAFTLVADSLIGFDSLLLAVTGQQRDTSSGHAVLGGAARGTVRLSGSIDTLEATGDVTVGELVFQQYRSPSLTGGFSWTGGRRPQLTASAVADTVIAGEWAFSRNSLSVAGYVDSLGWNVGTTAGAQARVDAAGSWRVRDSVHQIWFDTLQAALPTHRYRLLESATLTLDSVPTVSPVAVQALDGSGLVRVAGSLPSEKPGAMSLEVLGLELSDLYALLQRDTTGVHGDLGVSMDIGGTTRHPTFRGTVRLAEGRFGDFRSPFVLGVLNYTDAAARCQPQPLAHGREHPGGRGPPPAGPRADGSASSAGWKVRSRSGPTPTAWTSASSRP